MYRWFSVIFLLTFFQNNYAQNIPWEESRKLTWGDFKAIPQDDRFAASTYCLIGLIPKNTNILNGQTSYIITCEFVPDSSWYYKDKGSSEALMHEQLHFDIAELFARKMRQKLKRPVPPKIGKYIFSTLYDEYLEFQKLYESQTRYGSVKEEQKRWNALVKKRLRKLRSFALNEV